MSPGALFYSSVGGKYFAGILECDLADVHGPVLFKVGPGRVDDGDVVFLVACGRWVVVSAGGDDPPAGGWQTAMTDLLSSWPW